YNINNMQMIMRSLIYFEDADNEEFENNNVVSLQKETWNIIKKNIRTVYNKLLKKSTPLI
ncbi:MAG: nucleotidyltransferase, partial [Capnocytophaga endodontalis]